MRDAGRNQASALIVFVPGGWSGSWSWRDGTRLAARGNDSSGVPNQGKRDRVQIMSTGDRRAPDRELRSWAYVHVKTEFCGL
jgi:hypothetical protein